MISRLDHRSPCTTKLRYAFTQTGRLRFVWSSGAFAQAGGLTRPEQGDPISGTSQVGQAAVARDASTAW